MDSRPTDDAALAPLPLAALASFPKALVPVIDADEEVFLLYTRLAALRSPPTDQPSTFRGLGFLDAAKDLLSVKLEVTPRASETSVHIVATENKKRSAARKRARTREEDRRRVLEFELWQDKTALRSRAGDTGSVLWQARCVNSRAPVLQCLPLAKTPTASITFTPSMSSIDFAAFVLQQALFPYPSALFDSSRFGGAHVVELGAGTGFLAAALGSLFRRYTATDMPELIPLLRKNTSNDLKSSAYALDWTLPVARQLPDDVLTDPPDFLLAVDCIYNPSLISSLLNTLSALCVPNRTVTVVFSELRSEEVLRTFLEEWLARASERWRIWRVEDDSAGALEAVGARYAMWVAWREA